MAKVVPSVEGLEIDFEINGQALIDGLGNENPRSFKFPVAKTHTL